MENLVNYNSPDNFLREAYENIFNDSSYFYSLLSNQFDDKTEVVSDESIHYLVRNDHLKTPNTFKTIIMADDDEDDRMFFKEALQDLNFKTKIILLKDGAELMDHLHSNANPLPHIIFLDLNMPKKSGLECLVELKNSDHLKNIPVAIYSTSASEEEIHETYLKGASIYIKKPNHFSLIKKILRDVISVNWDLQRRNMNTYIVNSIYQ